MLQAMNADAAAEGLIIQQPVPEKILDKPQHDTSQLQAAQVARNEQKEAELETCSAQVYQLSF